MNVLITILAAAANAFSGANVVSPWLIRRDSGGVKDQDWLSYLLLLFNLARHSLEFAPKILLENDE